MDDIREHLVAMAFCAYCPSQLTDRSASPYFCSDGCQDQWNRARSDPWPWAWGTVKLPDDDDALAVRIKARFGIADNELGGAA